MNVNHWHCAWVNIVCGMTEKGFYLAPVIPAQHTLMMHIIMHVCVCLCPERGGGGGRGDFPSELANDCVRISQTCSYRL